MSEPRPGSRAPLAVILCALIIGGIALYRDTASKQPAGARSPSATSATPVPVATGTTYWASGASPAQVIIDTRIRYERAYAALSAHYADMELLGLTTDASLGRVEEIRARSHGMRITITFRPTRATDRLTTRVLSGTRPSVEVRHPQGGVLVDVLVVGTAAQPPSTRRAQQLAADSRLVTP